MREVCNLERAGSPCRLARAGSACRLEGRFEGAGSLLGLETGGGARPRMFTTWVEGRLSKKITFIE